MEKENNLEKKALLVGAKNMDGLKSPLSWAGYSSESVLSLNEAKEKISSNEYDLCFSEVDLYESYEGKSIPKGGIQLCNYLKEVSPKTKTWVIDKKFSSTNSFVEGVFVHGYDEFFLDNLESSLL